MEPTTTAQAIRPKGRRPAHLLRGPGGCSAKSRASDAQLASSGVAAREVAVRGGIDRVKLLVVDDARVLVDGVNLQAASSYTTHADVELSGLAVGSAAGVFNRDWRAAGVKPLGVVYKSIGDDGPRINLN